MNFALILAGGVGSRVGSKTPKQFIKVFGKPIMVYTLETFQNNNEVDEIVLVCIDAYMDLAKKYCKKFKIDKVKSFVSGGKEFIDSCLNGMNSIAGCAKDNDVILVTSADRPLISNEEIEDAIRVCKIHGSGIAARPCPLCMFKVGEDRDCSSEYLRNDLMQTSTPWAFNYKKLNDALLKYNNLEFKSEPYPIAIYAKAGNKVYFSKSKAENFKITEKHDIVLFEQIIKNRKKNKKWEK